MKNDDGSKIFIAKLFGYVQQLPEFLKGQLERYPFVVIVLLKNEIKF